MELTLSNFIWSNIFLLVLWMAYEFLFRNYLKPSNARVILLSSIVFCLAIPFIEIAPLASEAGREITILYQQIIAEAKDISHHLQLNFIVLIYFAGLGVGLIRLIYGLIQFSHYTKNSIWKGKYYELRESNAAFSFMGNIYLGENIAKEDLIYLLEHEENHLKKGHAIDLIFMQMIQIIFWFNPAVYRLRSLVEECHEFEADEAVRKQDELYIQALLKQRFQVNQFPIIHSFNNNHLKNRIMRIQNKEKMKLPLRHALGFIALFAILLVVKQNSFANSVSASSTIETALSNDKEASFPGGFQALVKHISENLKYPKTAKDNRLEGTVFVELSIDKDGKCSNQSIKKGINTELDQAALASVKNLPNWEPAEKEGKKVASKIVLPIKFKLPEEK